MFVLFPRVVGQKPFSFVTIGASKHQAFNKARASVMRRPNRLCYALAFRKISTSGIRTSSPLYLWTQQDRSRTPSTPIWSSRLYMSALDVRPAFQWEGSALPFSVHSDCTKAFNRAEKNPDLYGQDFFLLPPSSLAAQGQELRV